MFMKMSACRVSKTICIDPVCSLQAAACKLSGAGGQDILNLFFFSSRRRHTRFDCDWSSDVCSSDLSEIEIKRFKGLGEMNSEELWQTTLDPSKRVLLRVTLEQASEAEQMFSVLMGEDVERRRQVIEEHALEVKNLDV